MGDPLCETIQIYDAKNTNHTQLITTFLYGRRHLMVRKSLIYTNNILYASDRAGLLEQKVEP